MTSVHFREQGDVNFEITLTGLHCYTPTPRISHVVNPVHINLDSRQAGAHPYRPVPKQKVIPVFRNWKANVGSDDIRVPWINQPREFVRPCDKFSETWHQQKKVLVHHFIRDHLFNSPRHTRDLSYKNSIKM